MSPPRRRPFMKGPGDSQPGFPARLSVLSSMSGNGGKLRTMRITALLFAMLAACSQQAAEAPANQAAEPVAPASPAPASKPFTVKEKNDLIEFDYSWSAEAAAVPELVARFRADFHKTKADLISGAEEDKASRAKDGFDFHQYSSTTTFETAGQSPRLLSLREDGWSYTGGAHGNGGTAALLWDRANKKEIKVTDLFAEAANLDRLLTQRWCDALNKAREEKRGEPVGGGGMFDECPQLSEISVIPADKDGNGKLERLLLVADPYVAGPYVEGSYEIELPITGDLIAAIRSDFRENFEVQPQ